MVYYNLQCFARFISPLAFLLKIKISYYIYFLKFFPKYQFRLSRNIRREEGSHRVFLSSVVCADPLTCMACGVENRIGESSVWCVVVYCVM